MQVHSFYVAKSWFCYEFKLSLWGAGFSGLVYFSVLCRYIENIIMQS